jgi:thiol-disulfide isomerase/thioredoxin
MTKNALYLVIAIIAIGISVFFYKRYKIPPAVDIPAMALTDMQGNKVSLQSYAGHPLFLSFFATWCGPCMREMPELADMQTKLSDSTLKVVCICDEPVEKLQPLQQKFGDELIILHSEAKFHDIGIYTYPTNYIFNASGKKIYQKVDPDDWESAEVLERIKALLK